VPAEALRCASESLAEAIALDESLAEAHYVLAAVRYYHEWDWAGAERAFQRAIELKPNFAPARLIYSDFLLSMKRPTEAMEHVRRGVELDPLNAFSQGLLGWNLLCSRRYGDAIAQLRRALKTEPNSLVALRFLWAALCKEKRGNPGIYRFDAQTGAASFLAPGSHTARAQVSPDGKKIYYPSHPEFRRALVEYDLASGKARPVYGSAESVRTGNFELSPDGRYAATISMQDLDHVSGEGYRTTALLLVPIDGSEPRELMRVSRPEVLEAWSTLNWTPEGKALLVLKRIGEKREFWIVPVDGSKSHKLNVDISHWTLDNVRLHPNGRQIAFYSGEQSEEIWALENFLPQLSAKQ
jgi:hypothetical protein